MVCRPFGAKPLHCWLVVNWALKNELQWNLNQNTEISFMKMHLKASSVKWRPFCPGRYEFIHQTTPVYSIYRKSTPKWAILFPYPELCSTFYHRAPNPRKYHGWYKKRNWFLQDPRHMIREIVSAVCKSLLKVKWHDMWWGQSYFTNKDGKLLERNLRPLSILTDLSKMYVTVLIINSTIFSDLPLALRKCYICWVLLLKFARVTFYTT